MAKELFCPSCEQRTDFTKINGKWVCACGYELADIWDKLLINA